MAVTDVTNTGQTTAATNNASRQRLAENFEMFLTLLTTQMKNQDPLSPMDSNQFTQQIVQMTGVEQQLQTNDLLKQLVSNTATGIQAAVSLIGKDVKAVTDTTALTGGKAQWTYKLDAEAKDVKLEILDAKGNVVAARSGAGKTAGEHTFTWDGKTAEGSNANEGQYTLRITAKGSDGKSVAATTYVRGVVSGVEQNGGQTLLTINGGKVEWTKVTTITTPTTTPGGATTPPTETAGGGSTTDPTTDPSNPDDETSPPAQA